MLKVLDHPLGARSRTFQAHAHLISRLLLSFVLYLFASSHILAVVAQDVVNGQDVCQGFATVDNPEANSTLHAGSETDVSIDVSALKNTTLGIDLLEVYLVSSEAQKNITVSSGTQLLSQDLSSTVKHIHWTIPTCLQTGSYNLTLYETSHLNDLSFFAITPIPVQIENTGNATDTCDSLENALQAQPQLSNPPPADVVSDTKSQSGASPSDVASSSSAASQTGADSVAATATSSGNATASATSAEVTGTAIASGNVTASATSSDATTATPPSSSSTDGGSIITITAGDGDITVSVTGLPGTIVIEPSGGGPSQTMVASSTGFVTIFKTVAPTATATLTEIISAPVTITLEETYVSTVTASGTTEEFTVTQTVLSTTELVATQISSPQQAGLLPINSGSITLLPSALLFQTSLLACAFLYVLRPLL
ncbi:hypothetical protein VTO73DRAFT_1228 [Trametes versicolor]